MSSSSEESVMRGVLARALLNLLRFEKPYSDSVFVGVLLDEQSNAAHHMEHLEKVALSIGLEPTRVRRSYGAELFELEPGRRIVFFNRRTGGRQIRGESMDVLYAPASFMTPDRYEELYPALMVRDGNVELY